MRYINQCQWVRMPFNPMYASGVMKHHAKPHADHQQPQTAQQESEEYQVQPGSGSIHQPHSQPSPGPGWDSAQGDDDFNDSGAKEKMMAMAKEQALHKQNKTANQPKSIQEKIKFAVTFTLSLIAIGGLSALMFLVPFVVDPALATLTAGFSRKSVECRVIKTQPIVGASNCLWSSCREGCTRDIFRCHHIHVEYTMRQEDYSFIKAERQASGAPPPSFTQSAALLVNVRGCGYPPVVECEQWIKQFGLNNSVFPCHYATTNHSLAVTSVDEAGELSNLLLATLVPLCACVISSISLCLMHTQCIRICRAPRIYHVDDKYQSKINVGKTFKNDSQNSNFASEAVEGSSKKTVKHKSILQPRDLEDITSKEKKRKTKKQLSFQSAKGSLKRKADFFELPTFTKKVKTGDSAKDTSSTENLLPVELFDNTTTNNYVNVKLYNY